MAFTGDYQSIPEEETLLQGAELPAEEPVVTEEEDEPGWFQRNIGDPIKGFVAPFQQRAVENRNKIAAQEETLEEYKDDIETLNFKKPKQNFFGKVISKLTDTAIPDEVIPETANIRLGQNVGYNDTIDTLNQAVGTYENPDSLRYQYGEVMDYSESLAQQVEVGSISIKEAKAKIREREKTLSDEFVRQLDRFSLLEEDVPMNFQNMKRALVIADSYNNKKFDKETSKEFFDFTKEMKKLEKEKPEDKFMKETGVEQISFDINSTLDSISKDMYDSRTKKSEWDVNNKWEGEYLDAEHLKFFTKAMEDEMLKNVTRYSSSMASLYEQKDWANERGYDQLSSQLDKQIAKIQTLRDDQLSNTMNYYKYFINNVGSDGHKNLSQMNYQYEKNTGNQVEALTFNKGDDGKNWMTIDGRVSEIMGSSMIMAQAAHLVDTGKNKVESIETIAKGINDKNMKQALLGIGDYFKTEGQAIVDAYKLATETGGLALGSFGSHIFKPLSHRFLSMFNSLGPKNDGYKMAEDDIEKGLIEGHDQRKHGNWFGLGGNNRFAIDLKYPTPGAGQGYKALAVLQDYTPGVLQGIGEFLVMRKVMNPNRILKTNQMLKYIDEADDATRYVNNVGKNFYNGLKNAKNEKESIDAIQNAYKTASDGMKNAKFVSQMNKYAVARMAEQTVWMDSIFQAGRTEPMSNEDVAMSLIFGGTLDLMDVMKEMKYLNKFREANITSQLINNEKFIDNLGRKLNGVTKDGWKNASTAQRNIVRADARGYMNLVLQGIQDIKRGVTPKTYEEITNMLTEMANVNPSTMKKLEQEGANTVDTFYKEMKELQDAEQQLGVEKAIQDTNIKSEQEELKALTKEEDGTYSYSRTEFFIEPKEGRHNKNYFVNNILPQKLGLDYVNNMDRMLVGNMEYLVREGDAGFIKMQGDAGYYKNVDLHNIESGEDIPAAIYISKNGNINIGFSNQGQAIKFTGEPKILSTEKVPIKKQIKSFVDPITNKQTDTIVEKIEDTPFEAIQTISKKDIIADMEKQFAGYNTIDNPIPKKDYSTVSSLLDSSKGDQEVFIKSLNKSDINDNIKGYFNDLVADGAFIKPDTGKKNIFTKLYNKNLKRSISDMVNIEQFKDTIKNIGKRKMIPAVAVYIEENWKTIKGFRSKLKKLGIDISKISDIDLQNTFDTLSNSIHKTFKGEMSLKELFTEKTIRAYQLFDDVSEISLKTKRDAFIVIKKDMQELADDVLFQKQLKDMERSKDPILYLNNPKNIGFKDKYIRYQKGNIIINNMLDDPAVLSKVNYKNFRRDGNGSLSYFVMKDIYKDIGQQFIKDGTYFSKSLNGQINQIIGDVNEIAHKLVLDQGDYILANRLVNEYGQYLPVDQVDYLKKMIKKNKSKYKTVDIEQEANKLKENMRATAEGFKDEIPSDVVKKTLDEEIAVVEQELATYKGIVNMAKTDLVPTQKYLNGYSNRLARLTLPQSKDLVGDDYFLHSEQYRGIINKYGRLPDGSSMKENFAEPIKSMKSGPDGTPTKDFSLFKKSKYNKNIDFMNDVVLFSKGEPVESIRKTPAYMEKVKAATIQIQAMYKELSTKVGKKYGVDFAKKVAEYGEDLTLDKLSKMGIMFDHGDWMEAIRYIDLDFMNKLSTNTELGNKIRGPPKSTPIINTREYEAKRFYAINTLSHNSLTDAQANVLGGVVNSYWSRKLAKNTKYQKIKGTVAKLLNTPTYVFSQTILHPAQLLMMFIMNAQSLAVDRIWDATSLFTKNNIYDVRKKYHLMIGPQEYQDAGGIYRQYANGDLRGFKETVTAAGKDIAGKVREAGQIGIYNAAEITFDTNFRNSAVKKAIQDVTNTKTLDELNEFLKKKDAIGEKDRYLDEIRRRATEHYTVRNANNIQIAEGKFIYGNPYTIYGKVKKTLGWAYHFLGAWGNQHIRNYMRLADNGYANLNKVYGELMATAGKREADKLIQQFVQNNKDIDMAMMKMLSAVGIGEKLQRQESDRTDDAGWLEKLSDASHIGAAYYAASQGLMSSPLGRNIVNTIEGFMLDSGLSHTDLPAIMPGMIRMFETMMSNATRRTLNMNSIVKAMGAINASEEDGLKGLQDFMQERWKAFTSDTKGYTYFISNDIKDSGYSQDLYKSTASELEIIAPDFAAKKEDYYLLSTAERLAKLDLKIKDDGLEALWKWSLYKLPFVKNYKFGEFSTSTDVDKVLDAFYKLPEADNFYRGELNIDPTDSEYNEYVFSRLVEMAPYYNRNPKEMENGKAVEQRFNDFRMRFMSKKGSVIWDKQNKEDLFVKSMFDAMEKGDMQSYLDEFQRTSDGDVKAGLRLLGAVESMSRNEGVPGAARTLVSAIAQDRYRQIYSDMRTNAGYKYGEEPDDFYEKVEPIIKTQIVSEFGETLYTTDKDSWTSIALYYARENLPEFASRFSGGDIDENSVDEEGNPSLRKKTYYPVGLTYESNGYMDSKARQYFQLDMLTNMEVYAGNHNAVDYLNAINSIFMPSNDKEAKDPAYQQIIIDGVLDQMEVISNSSISEQDKLNLHVGGALALAKVASVVDADPELKAAIGDDVVDRVNQFIRGTGIQATKFEEELLQAEGTRIAYADLKKGGFEGTKATGTLLDGYDKNGSYRSSLLSKNPRTNWNNNKKYYSNIRTYTKDLYRKPKSYNYSSGYGSSSYYNKAMSNFYKYYYYFRNAKSKGIMTGLGKNKVSRNFRTKQTKLRVPISKSKK